MSLCDLCPRPGRCCSGFELNGGKFGEGKTALEIGADLARTQDIDDEGNVLGIGLPFLPLFLRSDGHWHFWCPNLTREGRCGDYENRPWACRHYQPLADHLCAMLTNAITATAFKYKRIAHAD